jgi:hypothetical protein
MIACKLIVPAFAKNASKREIIKGTIMFIINQQPQDVAIVEINKFGIQNHSVLITKKGDI